MRSAYWLLSGCRPTIFTKSTFVLLAFIHVHACFPLWSPSVKFSFTSFVQHVWMRKTTDFTLIFLPVFSFSFPPFFSLLFFCLYIFAAVSSLLVLPPTLKGLIWITLPSNPTSLSTRFFFFYPPSLYLFTPFVLVNSIYLPIAFYCHPQPHTPHPLPSHPPEPPPPPTSPTACMFKMESLSGAQPEGH